MTRLQRKAFAADVTGRNARSAAGGIVAIYGECIAAGLAAAVRVSKLVDTGCELLIEKGSVLLDGEFSLWIGAIGPLAITTSRCDEVTLSASFTQPLDPRIIAHFGDA